MHHRAKSVEDEVDELLRPFNIPWHVKEQALREAASGNELSTSASRDVLVKERAMAIFSRWYTGINS